ncbi:alpha/beta fold hydrolase [Bordetella sp. FB-8]|uniref:alpha/beta fold hydrolase n=1 Tax=Bordetella sp. FB-8 TaxID=1159870 RepID=UPI0003679CF3|nr:alpha/beta fold hydrolase [Bordetella sp. FB-8]
MALNLKGLVSFHIGGKSAQISDRPVQSRRLAQGASSRPVDPNGDYETGQMYVQGYLQAQPRHPFPVLLWHGGGMTGVNWETTPDGRPGWLHRFLEAGFDVYVSDAVERGRSGWNSFPEIYKDEPLFRSKNEAWQMFRFGTSQGYATNPDQRRPHPGVQFPVNAFDQFAKQWVPRWAGHEDITMQAYLALLRRVGPCFVIGHSQGGGFALKAARQAPEFVRKVVAIEPSGAPDHDPAISGLPPHLVVWGDYIAGHVTWQTYRHTVDGYVERLRDTKTAVSVLDLPEQDIRGNTHFVMLDRNADLIVRDVIAWLTTA